MVVKKEKMVRVSVSLTLKQKKALDSLSGRTRVPWAAYVREGVDLVLEKYKDQRA